MNVFFPSPDKKHVNRTKTKRVTFNTTNRTIKISPADRNEPQNIQYLQQLGLKYSQAANKLNMLISQKEDEMEKLEKQVQSNSRIIVKKKKLHKSIDKMKK